MAATSCIRCGRELTSVSVSVTPVCPVCDAGTIVIGDATPTDVMRRPTTPELPRVSGYEILGVLGQGGMGVVYRARQTALDRFVAIKVILPQLDAERHLARFQIELRSVAKLKHPNIVVVHDLITSDNRLCLVMELLEGETLARAIERRAFDERATWALIGQAAAGLAHADQLGIVHRDIKPENLFLIGGAELKITDFGLALLREPLESDAPLTRAGAVLGTPIYMAPEQLTNSRVDARADIYALGMTALHMLTGKLPFGRATIYEVIERKRGPMALPEQMSAAGRALLERMLAPNPEERIGSYAELIAALEALAPSPAMSAAIRGGSADATVELPAYRPPRRRRWIGALIGGVIVLALTLAAIAYWTRRTAEFAGTVGPALSLFNGKNLAGWKFGKGSWKPDVDEEGGTILKGQGTISRPLPSLEQFRLTLGMDRGTSSSVEIQFGVVEPERLVLRVTADAVVFGRQSGTEWTPIASQPTPPRDPDAAPYREMRIDRAGGQWKTYYHGTLIGAVPVRAGESPEIHLRADGGEARFESIEIAELIPRQ